MARSFTREEVRELDRRAIEEYGMPSIVLMENAGRACTRAAQEMLAASPPAGDEGRSVLVLCGPGNNGGDGFVIARTLWNRGVDVRLLFVGPPEKLSEASADVRTNERLWRGLGRELEFVEEAATLARLRHDLARAPLIVDALFGTGLARTLREPWAEVVRAVNASERPVLAVDLPSGLDANSGAILGVAVHATTTVTFVGRKTGFERGAGPEHCGRVLVAEIGIPRTLLEER